jgi:O-acetylserine/cysteine efflux transporter
LIAVALCIGVLHFGLNFWALKLSATVASPAIVLQSYAPMAALLAWWMLGERFDKKTGVAIGVSFAGVLVLGMDPAVLQSPAALALMLSSAFFLALGTVLMRDLVGLDVFSQQGWTAAIALLPLCALSFALEPNAFRQLSQADSTVWIGVAYSALVASLIGHGLYYRLLQKHPVASITPLLLAAPLLAALLGVVFLGDSPGPRLWLGASMILGGVLAIGARFGRKV